MAILQFLACEGGILVSDEDALTQRLPHQFCNFCWQLNGVTGQISDDDQALIPQAPCEGVDGVRILRN